MQSDFNLNHALQNLVNNDIERFYSEVPGHPSQNLSDGYYRFCFISNVAFEGTNFCCRLNMFMRYSRCQL